MADNTVLRIGAANGEGDARALFLKVSTGEVLTAFRRTTRFIDKHVTRTITSGKSAQFPASGRTGVRRMQPGKEITGGHMPINERVIHIDYPLLADISVWEFDEKMAHYDTRSEITHQLGEALAQNFDKTVAQCGVLAARDRAVVNGLPGGSTLTNAAYRTDGAALAAGIFGAAQALDEKDVPESERFGFFKPAQYYLLVNTPNIVNRDYGGEGSVASGFIPRVADIELVKTNNLPTSVVEATDEMPEKYAGDFSGVAGLVMHRSAVGTVKLVDIALETEYTVRRQSTLFVAKYMMGHGPLRAESAVELNVGSD